MMQAQVTDLRKKVADLKKSKDAIILAHNYQIPEVQDVADYVGDSLGLARILKTRGLFSACILWQKLPSYSMS